MGGVLVVDVVITIVPVVLVPDDYSSQPCYYPTPRSFVITLTVPHSRYLTLLLLQLVVLTFAVITCRYPAPRDDR